MSPSTTNERGKSRRGSETRKRKASLGFRASPEEQAKIQAAADRAGLTVSSYIRSRALEKPTTRAMRRPPLATAQLAQLLGMLGAAGGAVQRIAGLADASTTPDAAAALTAIRETASAILQVLGKRPHDH